MMTMNLLKVIGEALEIEEDNQEVSEREFQQLLRERNRRLGLKEQAAPATGLTEKEEADLRELCRCTPGTDINKIRGQMLADPKGLQKLRILNARHG
jgi:hypothetical protein